MTKPKVALSRASYDKWENKGLRSFLEYRDLGVAEVTGGRFGANVARAQLRAFFGELLRRLPDIQAGAPSYVAGNFIHAIRSMPCTF